MVQPPHDPGLEAAIAALWDRSRPELLERVALLQQASADLGHGRLGAQDARAAEAEAHKLAGLLGTFGLAEGTTLARRLEDAFGGGPEPADGPALVRTADALRALVEAGRGRRGHATSRRTTT